MFKSDNQLIFEAYQNRKMSFDEVVGELERLRECDDVVEFDSFAKAELYDKIIKKYKN